MEIKTDTVSCTFQITPSHLREWVHANRDLSDQTVLNLTEAADRILQAVFAYVPFIDVQHHGEETVRANDSSLRSGQRSVEIERTYPLSASGHETLVYRITVSDTIGDISDVVSALKREGLLDDGRRVKVLLDDVVHYEPIAKTSDNADFYLAYIFACVILAVTYMTF